MSTTLLGGAIIGFLIFLLMLLQHFMLKHRRGQLRDRKQRMHDIRYKDYDTKSKL
ncbi:MAG: hypothetical protein VW875_13650 [Planctomycetaceae bacterium]